MEVTQSDSAGGKRRINPTWSSESGAKKIRQSLEHIYGECFDFQVEEECILIEEAVPPKFAPAAIYKLHPFSQSAVLPSQVMGGLQLGPVSPTSLTYTCLSRDGSELLVQAAPLPMITTSTDDSWLSSTSIRVRGSSFAASPSCPDSFGGVVSDQGVISGTLGIPTSNHIDSSRRIIHHPSHLILKLTTPKLFSDNHESIAEKIGLQDPMLMHVLQGRNKPWDELRTTRISVFAEVHSHKNSQQKLIPSPSDGTSNPIDPSVDSGRQVLSFAWIEGDDRFAIIQYVDLSPSKVSVQSSPARTVQLPPPLLDTRRKLFSRLISEGNNAETSRIKSHVELKGTSYTTVGSELPYPSLVVWDEEGKLCAIAIGCRVAIYLSKPPSFTLLSAVNITDGVLISLKFIHGVLYASIFNTILCLCNFPGQQ
eukprot:scaffold45430_cov76-Cyclotella_meneghiniana.AAC.2